MAPYVPQLRNITPAKPIGVIPYCDVRYNKIDAALEPPIARVLNPVAQQVQHEIPYGQDFSGSGSIAYMKTERTKMPTARERS